MQLEKYYTCYIEWRLHIPYNPASARLTIGLLMFNALIQLKIIQYWWWFCRQWCRDIVSTIDRHPDKQKFISVCRYRVIESSPLVPVLFREVFTIPTSPFFHLLNVFSLIIMIIIIRFFRRGPTSPFFHLLNVFSLIIMIIIIRFFRRVFWECTEAITDQVTCTTPEVKFFER